jgi:pyrroloquinoline quinone biosynthesis protein D
MNRLELEARPTLAPRVRLQVDAVTGEPVLLYPEGVLELNVTAHDIASRCDGTATVASIVDALVNEYAAPPEELRADVLECLEDLLQRKLIVLES